MKGSLDVVKYLLENNLLHEKDKDQAFRISKDPEIVEYLILKGFKEHHDTLNKLRKACKTQDYKTVEALLQDSQITVDDIKRVLDLTFKAYNLEIAKLLLSKIPVEPNLFSKACSKYSLPVIKLLVELGHQVTTRHPSIATINPDLEVFKYLQQIVNRVPWNSVYRNGRVDIAEYLNQQCIKPIPSFMSRMQKYADVINYYKQYQ